MISYATILIEFIYIIYGHFVKIHTLPGGFFLFPPFYLALASNSKKH
jgi:hypothetical protein